MVPGYKVNNKERKKSEVHCFNRDLFNQLEPDQSADLEK